jgi:hypothetical protein
VGNCSLFNYGENMKFEITKTNGTVLTKEVDANDKDYIKRLKEIGWKELKPIKKKSKKNKK